MKNMKKLLLLLCTMLLGVNAAWAESLTLVSAQDTWTGGSFYTKSGVATTGWGHTYLSAASTTQPQVFINSNNAAESSGKFNCANGRHAVGNTFYINIQPGYVITGYSITFKGASGNVTFTAADGVTTATADDSTPQTLSVTGLSALQTYYTVTGASNAILTAYSITYEAVDGAKYRMLQCWNNNSDYTFYCYANSGTPAIMYETYNVTGINKFNPYYIWAAHNNSCKLLIQNVGTERYVKQFSGTSSNYSLLDATTSGAAENIKIACNYNYGNFYTLQSTSSASASYIDSFGSGDGSRVNIHNALHQGDIFRFIPVKAVNFVDISGADKAVTITASDATSGSYSTIYVATDGSDSFTLPSAYQYSLNDGVSYLSADDAATAIVAAGNTDLTVKVKGNIPSTIEGKSFKLNCKRGYVYYNGSQLAGTNDESSASVFAVVTYEGHTYLYDATNSAFVCHTTAATAGTNGNAALEDNSDFSKAVQDLAFGSTALGSYPFYIEETVYGNWLNMDGTPLCYMNTWKDFESGNGGNTYAITIVDDSFDNTAAIALLESYFHPSATVTYVISDASGVIFTSEAIPATLSETITELPSEYQRPYCTYSVTSTTVVAGNNNVPVTVSYNLPFTTSTTFGGATWYYATLRGKQLRADDSAKDGSGRYATNSTNERTDAYKWAFFGNPYTGIYVMNKNQGDGKYMYKESQIVFKSLANPIADNSALWAVTPNSNGGFTLRNIAGGATWYINDAGNGGNLGFWNSGSGANDAGSNWLVEAVPAEVTVTYDLYVGGVKVNTADAIAIANSAVDIPSSLVANYSTLAYEITHTGTIGDTDCTIDVTATLKSGLVLANALSNSKKYQLICERGGLSTYYDEANSRTVLASPVKTELGVSAKEFAILNYDSKYYLYSVSDEKFVTYQSAQIAPLADIVTGTSDAIAFSQTTNSIYEIRFDNSANKILNSSDSYNYGIVLNDWGTYETDWDGGCQYIIKEIGDFDATDALDALDDFFNGQTAFDNAITTLKAINWGLTASGNKGKPNYYNFIGTYSGYAGGEMGIIETLEGAGYSSSNLATAQDILANGYALNMPASGKFYRIKGNTSNMYLAAGLAANSKFKMTDATDATTIFYFDGTKLTNLSSGMCNGMNKDAWAWVVGESASTVVFQDGLTNGGYGIKSATCNFYDNGDGSSSADRGANVTINGSTNARYRSWYLTEITTLPIAIGSTTYATLCAPVALTIPANVQAYYISALTEKEATLSEITTTIAANTPVILKATAAGTYNFAITTGGTDVSSSNKLAGQVTAQTVDAGVAYTLQKNSVEDFVGLYPKAAGTMAGFKAYLPASNLPAAGVKGLSFIFADDNTTAIRSMEAETKTDGAIYNLAGQRVSKATKGVYIMNGKKMFVK